MRNAMLLILALAVPCSADSCYLLKGPGMDQDAYDNCKDQARENQGLSDKIDDQMRDMQNTSEQAGNNNAIAEDNRLLAPLQPVTVNLNDDSQTSDK